MYRSPFHFVVRTPTPSKPSFAPLHSFLCTLTFSTLHRRSPTGWQCLHREWGVIYTTLQSLPPRYIARYARLQNARAGVHYAWLKAQSWVYRDSATARLLGHDGKYNSRPTSCSRLQRYLTTLRNVSGITGQATQEVLPVCHIELEQWNTRPTHQVPHVH